MQKIGIVIFVLIVILLIGVAIFSKPFKTDLIKNNSISNSKVDQKENLEEKEEYRKEVNRVEREILELSNKINNDKN